MRIPSDSLAAREDTARSPLVAHALPVRLTAREDTARSPLVAHAHTVIHAQSNTNPNVVLPYARLGCRAIEQ
jgi:hypothetical protein